MTASRLPASPHVVPAPDVEKILEQFDLAWQSGNVPRIDAFANAGPAAGRRELLEELVCIDLEYRWRQSSRIPAGDPVPARPRLEDYVAQFPALGRLDQLAVESIAAEYTVRQHWGDRPALDEYLARFANYKSDLRPALQRIEAALAAEYAETGPSELPPVPMAKVATPAADLSSADLLAALRNHALLLPAQLDELNRNQAGRSSDAHALARALLERGWLTAFQVNQLCAGRSAELVLGPYLLLDRLGEGGVGQVFKARHQRLNRVVALKLLRKDLLADTEVVARFYREIQVISQLTHPNIVHAFDAGQAGAVHFLAMEYVEGVDLNKLVKQSGVLPVAQACDCIRQAALGLQHAHERGLVHRDVKPANLLLRIAESATVKIVDLGLARFQRTANDDATGFLTMRCTMGVATPAGAVMMGTPDYMAPEQALDFHKADIRADIYSLGCTLYFLLTGQPPFAGGTLAQKLLRHQQAEVPAVTKVRADIPPPVAAVLRRMLAKLPQERYQAPGEVAQALAPFSTATNAGGAGPGWTVRFREDTYREAVWRLIKRNKLASGFTAALAVVLVWSSLVNYFARRDAEKANQRARARTEKAVPALVQSARLLGSEGHFPQALEQVDFALEYDPSYVEGRLLKAQLFIAQRDWAAARIALEQYLRQQPKDADARKLLELCTREKPDDPAVLFALAQVFQQQKALGLAVHLFRGVELSKKARQPLLDLYRKRIDEAWLGLGGSLTMEENGNFQLNLSTQKRVVALDKLKGMEINVLNLGGCDQVTDLTPLRGMPLTALDLGGCGRLTDLTSLQGMKLTSLQLSSCRQLSDLSPLRGMPLTFLGLVECWNVSDLSPLRGMPLTSLHLFGKVSDLSPLQGMPLALLYLNGSLVSDLSPLKGMPLANLNLHSCAQVSGLSPLKGLPLTSLNLYFCGQVSDLSPLKGMLLTTLDLNTCGKVSDLSPLKGMPLTSLNLNSCGKVSDLSPLRGMPLTTLKLTGCPVRDVTPLQGMSLTEVWIAPKPVSKGMDVLRQMKSLKVIYFGGNSTDSAPAQEFWKRYDAGEFSK